MIISLELLSAAQSHTHFIITHCSIFCIYILQKTNKKHNILILMLFTIIIYTLYLPNATFISKKFTKI